MSMMNKAIQAIQKNQTFMVTTHCNPEGDALGSSLALALFLNQLGKKARVVIKDPIPYFLDFLPEKGLITQSSAIPGRFDIICVCDCGDIERTGYFKNPGPGEKIDYPAGEVINMDHHVTNTNFGTINWIEGEASATGEMVYDLIHAMKGSITPAIATAIYTTIITETGSFHYSNTTPKMFKIAAECAETGIDINLIARGIYDTSSEGRLALLGMVLNTLEVSHSGKIAHISVTGEMFKKTGTSPEDTENFVSFPRSIKGVEAAILFRENSPTEYKISLRSQTALDVSEVAHSFGGGGHRKAAGCTVQGALADVKKKVIQALGKKLHSS
ncbi:MAG: bifunctional oligoribonuclease/PAP phosphatase NrnA [Nitrospirae bacterium]|nr:bifunctional oligoribonuclease/PAP phosphatase NrnA [Nitrospirota bacterium]